MSKIAQVANGYAFDIDDKDIVSGTCLRGFVALVRRNQINTGNKYTADFIFAWTNINKCI